MINKAINYVRHGFPVIPLCWPDYTGKCDCGRNHQDRNIGKVPLTEHGLKDAAYTIEGVKQYWGRWPKANIGIVIPEGYFVIDIDIEHDGYTSFGILQNKIGELPKTLQITTGSGGAHFWYKTNIPIRNSTHLSGLNGIDIRGIGGYVVGPPSLHKGGNYYMVSPIWRGPITAAPDILIKLLTSVTYSPEVGTKAPTIPSVIAEGMRDSTLASLAGSLRARGLSEETIYLSLSEVNRNQCQPPLPDSDVQKIAKSVSRYAPKANDNKPGFKGGVII